MTIGVNQTTSPFATGSSPVTTPGGGTIGGTSIIPFNQTTSPFAVMSSGGQQGSGQSTSTPAVVQTPQSRYSLAFAKQAEAAGNQMYDWAGQNYGWLKGLANQTIPDYLKGAASADRLGQLQLGQYENMYAPEMAQFNQEANSYASAPRQAYAMGQAEADATQNGAAAWNNTKRDLQSMGIDPSSGMYAGLKSAADTAAGASAAGAGNQARQATEQTGLALQQASLGIGSTVPAAALNSLNTGASERTAAVNTAQSTANTGANLYNTADQFYNTASQVKLPNSGQDTQSTQQNTGVTPGSTTVLAHGGLVEPDDGYRRGGRVRGRGHRGHAPQGGGGADGGSATGNPATNRSAGMIANPNGTYSNPGFNFNGPGYSTAGWGSQSQPAKNPSLPTAPPGGAPAGLPDPNTSVADSSNGDGGIPDAGAAARGGPMDPHVPHGHEGRPHPPHPYHVNGLPDASTGGHVPYELSPSHGHTTDDVVANLNAGEFVLPRRTVHHLGHKFLYDLVAKGDKEMGLHPQPVGPQSVKAGSGAGKAREAATGQGGGL